MATISPGLLCIPCSEKVPNQGSAYLEKPSPIASPERLAKRIEEEVKKCFPNPAQKKRSSLPKLSSSKKTQSEESPTTNQEYPVLFFFEEEEKPSRRPREEAPTIPTLRITPTRESSPRVASFRATSFRATAPVANNRALTCLRILQEPSEA